MLIKNHCPIPDSVMNTHQIVENCRILERRVTEQATQIKQLEEICISMQHRMEQQFAVIQQLSENVKDEQIQNYIKNQYDLDTIINLDAKVLSLEKKNTRMITIIHQYLFPKIYISDSRAEDLCNFMMNGTFYKQNSESDSDYKIPDLILDEDSSEPPSLIGDTESDTVASLEDEDEDEDEDASLENESDNKSKDSEENSHLL